MMRGLCFTGLLLFSSLVSAQTFEDKIIAALCRQLVKEDQVLAERKATREKFKGVNFVGLVHPITLEEFDTLYFSDDIDPQQREFLKKYSNKQLMKIMGEARIPADNPLVPLADTTWILDTTKFFSGENSYTWNNYHFEIVTSIEKPVNAMNVYKAGIADNTVRIAFSFRDFREVLVYYFEVKRGKVRFLRSDWVSLITHYG